MSIIGAPGQMYCDDAPANLAPGWYPGVSCWDQEEGGFPSALYWDGEHWSRAGCSPFQYIPQRFEDAPAALERAYELDLGW